MSASRGVPLGIDVSTATFDVALLNGSQKVKRAQFENTSVGFTALSQGLHEQPTEAVHGGLEPIRKPQTKP